MDTDHLVVSHSPPVYHYFAAYILWVCLGFLHGLHWIYLLYFSAPGSGRIDCGRHLAFYWVSHGLFWAFRQPMLDWHVECEGGESMSVSCLFEEQPVKYQVFYALHIILMFFLFYHWVLDGACLWLWVRRVVSPCGLRAGWVIPLTIFLTCATCGAYVAFEML
eukprot:Rmarinus@m.23519